MSPEGEQVLGRVDAVKPPPKKTQKRVIPPLAPQPPLHHEPSEKPTDKKPQEKKSWIKSRIAKIGLALTAFTTLIGGYEAYQHDMIPGIHQNVDRPFDVNKLDTEAQTIVAGINAREITQEEKQGIINAALPDMKAQKSLEDIPYTHGILSIDMQKAGSIKIKRVPLNMYVDGKMVSAPVNFNVEISNPNTPVGVFIPEGVKTDSVEIFLIKLSGGSGVNSIVEKFNIGDGRYAFVEIRSDKVFILDDSIKNATSIDPSHPKSGKNYHHDLLQETGTKFNLSEKPTLIMTSSPQVVLNFVISYETAGSVIVVPASQDGNLLYSKPR